MTGAMLVAGDYSITVKKRFVEFGSSTKMAAWRTLLAVHRAFRVQTNARCTRSGA